MNVISYYLFCVGLNLIDAVVENGQLKNYNIGCVYGQKATNTKITNVYIYSFITSFNFCHIFTIAYVSNSQYLSNAFFILSCSSCEYSPKLA